LNRQHWPFTASGAATSQCGWELPQCPGSVSIAGKRQSSRSLDQDFGGFGEKGAAKNTCYWGSRSAENDLMDRQIFTKLLCPSLFITNTFSATAKHLIARWLVSHCRSVAHYVKCAEHKELKNWPFSSAAFTVVNKHTPETKQLQMNTDIDLIHAVFPDKIWHYF